MMDNKTRIALSQLNLSISINRLLIRLRMEKSEGERKTNIEREIHDLDNVKFLLQDLEKQIEHEHYINTNLQLEILKLKEYISNMKVSDENTI